MLLRIFGFYALGPRFGNACLMLLVILTNTHIPHLLTVHGSTSMVSYTSECVSKMEEFSSTRMISITHIGQPVRVTIVLRVLFVSQWIPMASFFQGCIFQIWLILGNT
ncbi:hypothetical protein AAHE18_12G219600 [Arachis hypogaea]